jgi:hypothetical protein
MMKYAIMWWIALLFILVLGCGGAAPIRGSQSAAAHAPAQAPAGAPGAAYEQPDPAADAERPGLGTAFGESRESRSKSAQFTRDRNEPMAVGSLWYNDSEGARAMSGVPGYRQEGRPVVPVLDGMITVRLEGENGRVLPGFVADNKTYVIGQPGERYIVKIQNHTGYRFEVVASVDGLDVIDGRPASFAKRGYILHPNSTLPIEGFRTSESTIAAFRFSSVRGSYSAKSGQGDQNVGVIGVAFFNEQGVTPQWGPDEVNRRKDANPFPAGGYAQPPSN